MFPSIKNLAMPLVFLGALLFSMFFCSVIPYDAKSFLYACSISIKELLIFALPFVIFSLVFSSITKIGTKAFKYIIIIVPLICCSNFLNTIISYFISFLRADFSGSIQTENLEASLEPYFNFHLSAVISNDIALILGAILGLIFCFVKCDSTKKISNILDCFTKLFFKAIVPVMPLFIIGSALKLQHDGMLTVIFEKYLPIFLIFIGSAYSYVFLQYFILSKFSIQKIKQYLNNVFPAVVTAFGSMSSAAALPISIKAAENNVEQKGNADIIVPASVNIHLVGDCFFIPMIALVIMSSFGQAFPSFSEYLHFALHFVLAKFAVAAVPGGGILVMLPIMQQYLGFSSDMLALVTALYILFDPFITACNVAGNGALAIVFDKITAAFLKRPSKYDVKE